MLFLLPTFTIASILLAEAAVDPSSAILNTIGNSSVSAVAIGTLVWLVKHWQSKTLPDIIDRHSQVLAVQRTDFLAALKSQSDACKEEQANIHQNWKLVIDHYLKTGPK